jgi:hypothetical protein
VAHERLEQRDLARREDDLGRAAPRAVRSRVEPQAPGREHRGPPARRAPHERPQPREQLGEGERLRQVVVGARVEPAHAVLDGVARGEHDDRRPDARGAHPPARLDAVHVRHQDVEHHRVVGAGARQRSPSSPPPAMSATSPSNPSPRRTAAAIRGSSSTRSTRTRRSSPLGMSAR